MTTLRAFYTTSLATLATLIAAFTIFVTSHIPLVQAKFGDGKLGDDIVKCLKLLVSSTVLGVIFSFGAWVVRTRLWKWRYARSNVSGAWYGITTYDRLVSGASTAPLPHRSVHPVEIVQDCCSIEIGRRDADDYAAWHSVACNLVERESSLVLEFAYTVSYKNENEKPPRFPPHAIGFEEMSIVQYASRFKRWPLSVLEVPIRMSGTFAHCVDGDGPRYAGTTVFVRKGFLEKVSLSDVEKQVLKEKGVTVQP
jgi:hypothetical protein